DIPQANTLIVERADIFGLSQLYQIRGRVGRSRERAYAYLLYDASDSLSGEAAQRLAALSDFTELGSGFQIAMRDLELRGAGNLLGDEQSGHVAALGFELYMQMLDEALAAAQAEGGSGEDWEPVRLDVDVDAYVPAEYVGYEQAKIELHRRIAAAREVADVELLREELADRFGPPPEPVENLLAIARARIRLGAAGARAVGVRGGRVTVSPIELDSAAVHDLRERLPGAVYESGRSQVVVRVSADARERFGEILAVADAIAAAAGARG
ncbi:MAG TPA: TRCF domain-containing protein, partial [Solirubrobacteraceae bacterium]